MTRIILDDADNLVTASGPILFQVRRGQLSLDAIETIALGYRMLRRREHGNVAMFSVVLPTASVLGSEERERQREIVTQILQDPGARSAAVFLGAEANASLQRALARGIRQPVSQARVFTSIEDGARWLASELKIEASTLITSVQDLVNRA